MSWARWEAYPFWGVFTLSLFAFFTPGTDLPSGPDVSDKIEHAAIFAVLAVTGRFAGYRASLVLASLAAYAAVSEVLQAVLPIHRDGDWRDALADFLGVVLGLAAVAALGRLLRGTGRSSG